MSTRLIQDLHAGISRRDWSSVETASNRLRDDVEETIRILAGTDISSLPNDYPLPRIAERCEADRRERIAQCDRMANDWAEFCEAMGVRWDTQEAVAAELKAKASATAIRIRDLEERLAKAAEALEQIADLTARCEHDGGFDREIGPIGCNLGDKCLCIGLHPIACKALSTVEKAHD